MRSVSLLSIGECSCLGMGCASLGSRVSAAAGGRALDAAFHAGVNWFDVAPSYGAGEAEAILGGFLRGKRNQVRLVTKVGLLPPERPMLTKSAYAFARPVMGLMGGLRRHFRRAPVTPARKPELTGDLVRSSLDRSLASLRTDFVDVLALHDPSPAMLRRDDIVRALEDAVRSGKARALAVAGDMRAALASLDHGLPYDFVQVADDPETRPMDLLAGQAVRPVSYITHSIFGVGGMRERLLARLSANPVARLRLAAGGYDGPLGVAVPQLLLDRAFAANPAGVVLVSMFTLANRRANLARAGFPINMDAIALVDELLREPAESTA